MLATVSRHWWLLALRGVLGIAFGIGALVWPGLTLAVLILFFGAYMFVDGVTALVTAIRLRHEKGRFLALLGEGLLGIALGLLTYLWPGMTVLAWAYVIAGWAIVTGVLEIATAFRLHGPAQTEVFLVLAGILSIVVGLAFALIPLAALVVWVWLVGCYAIVFGVLLLVVALRARGKGAGQPLTTSGASTIP